MKDNNGLDLIKLDSCASTNDELHLLAKSGAAEGTVVIARTQTGGKGTNGRSFFSPEKTGIYMSVLLRSVESEHILHVTPLAAVVVSQTLDELCGVSTRIKKVNDIYLDGKKVCGILTKAESNAKNINFIIVGIGINLFKPQNGFPDEISQSAGFVCEAYSEELREKVIAAVAKRLVDASKRLADEDFTKQMYDYYESRCIIPENT